MLAVRWYLRYSLSYRDVEELLAERGITVDHVTIYRWVQRFTPELIDAARPSRHVAGDRWFVDETYLKLAGRWVYLYRAIDQHGQVIDVLASPKRDLAATRRFFARALNAARRPTEVTTDRAPAYPRVLDELVPEACHVVEQYANNPIETDHGRLKARTRPMRGLQRIRSAQLVCIGHTFVQNLRRRHYDLGLDTEPGRRLEAIFTRTRPCHLTSASIRGDYFFLPNATAPRNRLGGLVHEYVQVASRDRVLGTHRVNQRHIGSQLARDIFGQLQVNRTGPLLRRHPNASRTIVGMLDVLTIWREDLVSGFIVATMSTI